ncbi:hypothetical protein DFJ73DRAFT_809364 [Zopfochytrium polystomum]|nr:hypothetical protein DFJ73DRAFT_809364 [Zopfochytrium polystomum]
MGSGLEKPFKEGPLTTNQFSSRISMKRTRTDRRGRFSLQPESNFTRNRPGDSIQDHRSQLRKDEEGMSVNKAAPVSVAENPTELPGLNSFQNAQNLPGFDFGNRENGKEQSRLDPPANSLCPSSGRPGIPVMPRPPAVGQSGLMPPPFGIGNPPSAKSSQPPIPPPTSTSSGSTPQFPFPLPPPFPPPGVPSHRVCLQVCHPQRPR